MWVSVTFLAALSASCTSGKQYLPTFASHPSLSTRTAKRLHTAFVDNDFTSRPKSKSLAKAMPSDCPVDGVTSGNAGESAPVLKDVKGDIDDAEAYHSMVSSAVDLTNIYVRNGFVSGKSLLVQRNSDYYHYLSNLILINILFWYINFALFLLKLPGPFVTSTPTLGAHSFTIFLCHRGKTTFLLL